MNDITNSGKKSCWLLCLHQGNVFNLATTARLAPGVLCLLILGQYHKNVSFCHTKERQQFANELSQQNRTGGVVSHNKVTPTTFI